MKKDPKATARQAADAIADLIDSNFDIAAAIDSKFITQVLGVLGLRKNEAHMAQVAALLFAKKILVRAEYPKMKYRAMDDGTIARQKVHNADEEKALGAGWLDARPTVGDDGADKAKPKTKK